MIRRSGATNSMTSCAIGRRRLPHTTFKRGLAVAVNRSVAIKMLKAALFGLAAERVQNLGFVEPFDDIDIFPLACLEVLLLRVAKHLQVAVAIQVHTDEEV